MGLISGFAGGVTVTLAVAYYTVLSHERNRQAQAIILRYQTRTLNSLFEPQPPLGPTRAELLRAERSTLLETAKDRWNLEIEKAVRSIQHTDWEQIREARDETIAKVLGEGLEGARHGIENAEKKIGANVSVIGEKARKTLSEGKEKAAAKTSQITEELPSKVEQLRTRASRSSAGTVDAVRGALRDAISKDTEKDFEKERKLVRKVAFSEVERALEERYKPRSASVLDRSPEEVLADRYKSTG